MGLAEPIDAMFLMAESRAHPMHVGSLLLFEPPVEAGREFAADAYERLVAAGPVDPLFRTRPARWLGATRPWWTVDAEVDLRAHVHRWALPGPGGRRELSELVSQLHSTSLDPARPLWEVHLIEGAADGRLGLYAKVHHALLDGVAAMRLLLAALTTDPAERAGVPWRLDHTRNRSGQRQATSPARNPWTVPVPSPAVALRAAHTVLAHQRLLLPTPAPRTIFNVPIGAARRCAARSWSRESVQQISKATDATINDVVLAICAGGLRAFLLDRNALPHTPLVAMTPMSLREPGQAGAGASGNRLATLLCPLATQHADPLRRLESISASTTRAKNLYRSLPAAVATALSGLLLSPLALTQVPGLGAWLPPLFNLVISTVPGPSDARFWHGARLDACHPLSIPVGGLAVNITVASTATGFDVGITSCRNAVPDPDELLDYLGQSLTELEQRC